MNLKALLGGSSKWDRAKRKKRGPKAEMAAAGPTLDDLIALEDYEAAAEHLKQHLKQQPGDLYAHLRLAEVYEASRKLEEAIEEYVHVAGEYARDGFYDKGLALLARALKLHPLDDSLRTRISAFEQAKRLETSRLAALDGVRSGEGSSVERQRFALEVQKLWKGIASSLLVRSLTDDQLSRLFSTMALVRVAPGTILAEQGSTKPQLALISRGLVEVFVVDAVGKETVLRTFSAGDIIGEGALLEHQPWPAHYRAGAEGANLLVLNRAGVERALLGNPDPRRFLDVLRSQHSDRDVAEAVNQLKDPC